MTQESTVQERRQAIAVSIQRYFNRFNQVEDIQASIMNFFADLDAEGIVGLWPDLIEVIEENVPAEMIVTTLADVASVLPSASGLSKTKRTSTFTREDFLALVPEYAAAIQALEVANARIAELERTLVEYEQGFSYFAEMSQKSLPELRSLLRDDTAERTRVVSDLRQMIFDAQTDQVQAERAAALLRKDGRQMIEDELNK